MTRVFNYSNAVVRVTIPTLTDEERKTRMEKIKATAEALLKGGKNETNTKTKSAYVS